MPHPMDINTTALPTTPSPKPCFGDRLTCQTGSPPPHRHTQSIVPSEMGDGEKKGIGMAEVAGVAVLCCAVLCCVVPKALLPEGNGRDVYPRVQVNGRAVCVVRAVRTCVVSGRK